MPNRFVSTIVKHPVHAQKGEQKNAFNERCEYWVTCYLKRCVNMWTVCAQPDGSMSSLLQSTGSSPYVLVHMVGPLAATKAKQKKNKGCTYTPRSIECAHRKYEKVNVTKNKQSYRILEHTVFCSGKGNVAKVHNLEFFSCRRCFLSFHLKVKY